MTDAKDYVSPGTLHCFSPDGRRKWSVTTGDIPAHIVFTHKPLIPLKNEKTFQDSAYSAYYCSRGELQHV